MPTLLDKPVRRELPIEFDRSKWIVELKPWGLSVRRKRTQTSYALDWAAIIDRAIKSAVEAERREKAEERRKVRGDILERRKRK